MSETHNTAGRPLGGWFRRRIILPVKLWSILGLMMLAYGVLWLSGTLLSWLLPAPRRPS